MVLEASRDVSPVSLPRAYQSRAEVKHLARRRACGFESHSPNKRWIRHHNWLLVLVLAATFTLFSDIIVYRGGEGLGREMVQPFFL